MTIDKTLRIERSIAVVRTRREQPRNPGLPQWVRILGLLLALNLLSALALQFAPELHRELHDQHDHTHQDGTGGQGHDCLITLLQTGSLELTSVALAAGILLLILLFAPALPAFISLPEVAYRLLPGRAPPAVA